MSGIFAYMNGLNFKVNVLVNIPLPFGRFSDLGFISSTIGGASGYRLGGGFNGFVLNMF